MNTTKQNKESPTHLKIKSDGTIEFLGPPPHGFPGSFKQERFSEILPTNPCLRIAFRFLRRVFGESGKVAHWTRQWRVEWKAQILMGKYKGQTLHHYDRIALAIWEQDKWRDSRNPFNPS